MNKVLKYAIEIVVVLVVLGVCFYGVTKINTSVTRGGEQEIEISFEAPNFDREILEKVVIGDKVIDNARTTLLGEVINISEIYPHKLTIKDYDQKKYVNKVVANKFNRDLTVRAMANVSEKNIMIGETELKVGYTIPIKNGKYVLSSIITKIEVK